MAVDSLAPLDAAEWGLRVALHAASPKGENLSLPVIPTSWRFPGQVVFAIRHPAGQGTELWARAGADEQGIACHAILSPVEGSVGAADLTPRCGPAATIPIGLEFHPAPRAPPAAALLPAASLAGGWTQHRFDAERSAALVATPGAARTAGWRAESHSDIRASVSVVDSLVFVGGHGTGLLSAYSLATGARVWLARVPNWVHQEPVSDGRVLVLGFGDNRRSFEGRAPSGVAAFVASTGTRLWTEFDESSVMTSPIIIDSTLVYGSAAGMIRRRMLTTGALLQEVVLPGGVVMGPPVLRGDTLVVTLDINAVCALLASSLRVLWCQRLPGLIYVGHASAALSGNVVVVSAVATAATLPLTQALRLPLMTQLRLLGAVLFPSSDGTISSGQVFVGLDLASGAVRWRSPVFPKRREVEGHPAGTATTRGDIGVIVLPAADSVIAFQPSSGKLLWGAGGHRARGAPLIVDGIVIVAGRDGVIESRDLTSGFLRCTLGRSVGFDRAGPALAGNLLLFADLKGGVEAIPQQQLTACASAAAVHP